MVFSAICSIVISFPLFPTDVCSGGERGFVVDDSVRESPAARAFSDSLAHYITAGIFENFGETEPALREYAEAIRLRGDVPELYLREGAVYLLSREFDKALADFKKAKDLDPKDTRSDIFTGIVHAAKGDMDAAKLKYEEVLSKEPNSMKALAFLADLFVFQGKLREAAEIYEKMTVIQPGEPVYWFNLGVIYSRMEKLDKAEANLRKAVELNDYYVEAQMALGLLYEIENKIDEAKAQYETVTDLDPMNTGAYSRIGHIYYRMGDSDKAVDEFRILMRLDPKSEEPYIRIFGIYVSQKRYPDAEKILRDAVSNGIDSALVYAGLGYAGFLKKDPAMAAENYGIAAAIEPKDPGYLFYQAVALDTAGKRKEAISALERCVALEKKLPQAYNYLGYIYAEGGVEIDRAVELIRTALELEPKNGSFYDSMGWALYRKGEYAKALEYAAKAAEYLPKDPVVNEHLGDILYKLGEKDRAREAWGKAVETVPSSKAKDKMEALDKEPEKTN
jgi:tetratricopeptide (TPR) repeat protein